jgi:hypothetical protein
MKKVVPILALVVLVAAIVLVVLRPGSGGGDPARPGGLVEAIGGLLPARDLVSADVQGQPCWDHGALVVPPGGTCVTSLPDAATRMRLCTTQGVPDVRVAGASYGPQRFKPAQLDCSNPTAISLYDDGSRLLVACLGTTPCALRLV